MEMRDIHKSAYLTVFEGTFSQRPIRQGETQTTGNRRRKVIALLAVLALTATTAAGALTIRLRSAAPTVETDANSNFVRLPTLGSYEDALY
jgi:hypothetical protein